MLVALPFETLEECGIDEWKVLLSRIDHVHQDDGVTPVPEVLQPHQQRFGIVEQVAQNDDQSAPLDPLGQVMRDRPDRGLAPAGLRSSSSQCCLRCAGVLAGRAVEFENLFPVGLSFGEAEESQVHLRWKLITDFAHVDRPGFAVAGTG